MAEMFKLDARNLCQHGWQSGAGWNGDRHHGELFEKRPVEGIGTGWHTFALHWSPDEYVFYIDGKESLRTSAGGVSQVPEFLQFTVEFNKFHHRFIDEVEFPDRFVVDYVRIYALVSSENGGAVYKPRALEEFVQEGREAE